MKGNDSLVKKIIFLIIISLLVLVSTYLFVKKRTSSNSIAKDIESPVTISETEDLGKPFDPDQQKKNEPKSNSAGLEKAVNQSLQGTHGTYGIVVKNLKTGESFELNSHTVFPPASMYKLWVMAVAFNQIEQGKMTLDTSMSANVVDLNKEFNIDKEYAELTDGGFTFTVGEALERMMIVSHNYAAFMLTHKIGLKSIAPFLRSNGLLESKVGVNGNLPTSTASDMALFFEKLYDGKLASPMITQEMIALLKKQQLNYALPKYLPSGVEFAHKTGNIDEFTHDGGIVFSEKGDYIIIIMSKSDNPELAEERIANVSKAVWDYFEN